MKKLNLSLAILLLVLIGCKLPETLSRGGGIGGDSKGTETGGSDPRADITAASKKFIDLPFFTAKIDGQGTTPIRSEVSYASPDKYHVKFINGTGSGIEMIFIGKESFMKMGDKWTKMPTNPASIPTLRDSFTEEGLKTLSDTKYEGEDTLDGRPTSVYSFKNSTPVGNYPFTCKMWVSKKSGTPLKIYTEYPNNNALKNMTINYDIDTPVTIDAPVK